MTKANILCRDIRWEILPLENMAKASLNLIAHNLLDETSDFEISILATGDGEVLNLNRDHRGFAYATNILSWPEYEYERVKPGCLPRRVLKQPVPLQGLGFLGNLAISFDICAREASVRNISLNDHVPHLLLHGILHLIGFDHQDELDALLILIFNS